MDRSVVVRPSGPALAKCYDFFIRVEVAGEFRCVHSVEIMRGQANFTFKSIVDVRVVLFFPNVRIYQREFFESEKPLERGLGNLVQILQPKQQDVESICLIDFVPFRVRKLFIV